MEEITINDWRRKLCETELNNSAKLVGLVLANYFFSGKPCYPSILTIAEDCSLSKPTVINSIKSLVNCGLIEIQKNKIKYLSALQNYYIFVGVNNGKSDSKGDSKTKGKSNGKSNGKTKGKTVLPYNIDIYDNYDNYDNIDNLNTEKEKEKENQEEFFKVEW